MKPSLFSLPGIALVFAPGLLLAQSPSAADVARAATEKPQAFTLLHLLEQGGWAIVILGLMSVLMVTLILVYLLTLRRGAVVSSHFMNTADVLLKKKDYPALLAIANRHGESIAHVLRRTLDFASQNPGANFEIIREIAQTEGASQANALQHRITYLADIAVLAPMVGLLGTVFGIIRSFGVMGSSVAEAKRFTLLSEGVSEALVATGAGLIIGIIAMACYGFFRNRVGHLISELERASTHLLGLLAVNLQSPPSRREAAPAEPRRERPARETPNPRRPAVSVDDDF